MDKELSFQTIYTDSLKPYSDQSIFEIPSQSDDLMATVELSDQILLGDGYEIEVRLERFDKEWTLINKIDWKSYGEKGLTVVDPNGQILINPSPTLMCPCNKNMVIRLVVTPNQPMDFAINIKSK